MEDTGESNYSRSKEQNTKAPDAKWNAILEKLKEQGTTQGKDAEIALAR